MKIALHGPLDEHMRLPEVPSYIEGRLEVDLQNLESINSVGCRTWIQWIQNVKTSEGIELYNCPPQFIVQASILFGAVPEGVSIRSFYVPYYCDSCGAEELLKVECQDLQSLADLNIKDEIICPICSALMTIDVVKPKFFAFLAA